MSGFSDNDWRTYKTNRSSLNSPYSNNDWRDYCMTNDEYLAHYGIKGMKWGKHIGNTIASGAHVLGNTIASGAHAVISGGHSAVNTVLTTVGLKKDKKRKHARGKAKKRKVKSGYHGYSTYKDQRAADRVKEKLSTLKR